MDELTYNAVFEAIDAESIKSYESGGRRYRFLSDADLLATWKLAAAAWADDFMNPDLRDDFADATSEFSLRGIPMPVEHAKSACDSILLSAKSALQDIIDAGGSKWLEHSYIEEVKKCAN